MVPCGLQSRTSIHFLKIRNPIWHVYRCWTGTASCACTHDPSKTLERRRSQGRILHACRSRAIQPGRAESLVGFAQAQTGPGC